MIDLTVLIVTKDEAKHIGRCLDSFKGVTDKFFIVDSGSTDDTVKIAEAKGAVVKYNPWVSYSFQFNHAIDHNPHQTKWLMRMDADEYITPELASELNQMFSQGTEDPTITGYYVKRRVMFMDKWIKRGGYYPIWLLRVWRLGKGRCEELWMDEHIKLTAGSVGHLQHDLVDHNLNDLTWWTQKHNNYATREVIDLLNIQYNFEDKETVDPAFFGTQEQRTRFLKIQYSKFPLFTRPFVYFSYRYFFKLGFLDGMKGVIWHVLQGFWYRFLVDAKMYEVYRNAGKEKESIITYFKNQHGKDLRNPNGSIKV